MTPLHDFDHVRWIGGSASAGKSSVAQTLAERYGYTIFDCDAAWERHKLIVTPEDQPTFHRVKGLTWEAIWLRPVSQQLAEELEIYREEFPLLLADLAALPTDRPILAEGNALLPELLVGAGISTDHAIWIVPTLEFQLHHYGQRPWIHDILAETPDSETAWRNWMARDAGFAAKVTRQAIALGCPLITVDGSAPVEATVTAVERHFGLAPRRTQ